MTLLRTIAIGLLAATTACAPGADGIPQCEGLQQISITSVAGSGYTTREQAAVHALEISYEVDLDQVVLAPAGGRRFRVVLADLTQVDDPLLVSISRTESGFIPEGITC